MAETSKPFMAGSEKREHIIATVRQDNRFIEIRVSDAGPGLVEAQGGTLQADDRPGGHTIFRFKVAAARTTCRDPVTPPSFGLCFSCQQSSFA